MDFGQLVGTAHVLLQIPAETRWDVLRAIAQHPGRGHGKDDEVYRALEAREKSLSTGLEQGVAIPHGFVAELAAPILVIATLRVPVLWDSLDGLPVSLVGALLMPATPAGRAQHLPLLAGLGGRMANPRVRELLRNARDADLVRAALLPDGER